MTLQEIAIEQKAIWRRMRLSAGLLVIGVVCMEAAMQSARRVLPLWTGIPLLIVGATLAARAFGISFEIQRRNNAVNDAIQKIDREGE